MLRRSLYSLMRIERTSPEDPVVRCEPGQLTGRDVQEFLSKAEIQNRGNGGLRRFCRVYGLLYVATHLRTHPGLIAQPGAW